MRERVGGVAIVVDDEDPSPRRRQRRGGPSLARRAAPTSRTRQARRRTRCPCRGRRCAPRRCRRASARGCATSVRPMPSPPCERRFERSTCMNMSNTRSSMRRRDADAVVAARETTRLRRAAPRRERDAPAGVGVLGGVRQQVREHLREPHRVAVDRDRLASGKSTVEPVPRGLDHRPASSRRPCAAASARSIGSRCTSITPRVMRETSSRSSTRRTRCVDLPLHDCRRRPRRGLRVACRRSFSSCSRVEQRRERIAQLVAERREELVLALVGRSERPPRRARAPRDGRGSDTGGGARARPCGPRSEQRGDAQRPLEQRHVAERAHRFARPRRIGARPRQQQHGQIRPRRLLAQHGREPQRCRPRASASSAIRSTAAPRASSREQRRRTSQQTRRSMPAGGAASRVDRAVLRR